MGLFSSSGSKPNSQAQGKAPQITLPDDVLISLNLTKADIESYYHGLIAKEATENGINYYKEIGTDITQAQPVRLGEIAINPNVQDKSDVVDSIYRQIDEMATAMESSLKPESLKTIRAHLSAFATGFGQAALENRDWQTAIKSFDITTEGGIIHNSEVIKNLGEVFKDDRETRIKIAELIQERVNTQSQNKKPQLLSENETLPPNPPAPFQESATITQPKHDTTPLAFTPKPDTNTTPPPPSAALRTDPASTPRQPINLAEVKTPTPITTASGQILRPVPTQNPSTLAA